MKFTLLVAASALVVGLSFTGPASAWPEHRDHRSTSVSTAVTGSLQGGEVEGNVTVLGGTTVQIGGDTVNKVDDYGFDSAQGLFNVQQNAGQNSLQQAGNTLGAILSSNKGGRTGALALSAQVAEVESNGAYLNGDSATTIADNNRISDAAFSNAVGLFNVSQNTGNNSMQQASNTVAAVIGPSH